MASIFKTKRSARKGLRPPTSIVLVLRRVRTKLQNSNRSPGSPEAASAYGTSFLSMIMDFSFCTLTSYYSRTVTPFVVHRIPSREHFVAPILLVYHYRVFVYSETNPSAANIQGLRSDTRRSYFLPVAWLTLHRRQSFCVKYLGALAFTDFGRIHDLIVGHNKSTHS